MKLVKPSKLESASSQGKQDKMSGVKETQQAKGGTQLEAAKKYSEESQHFHS